MASSVAGLRVLQLGPLYVEHVRRWGENAAALGCEVHVAGHVRTGRQLTDFGSLSGSLRIGPPNPERPNTTAHESWLRELLTEVRPDLIQAHWLRTWGWFAARSGHPRVAVTPWGSDLYDSQGALAARAQEALVAGGWAIARSPHMRREIVARGVAVERVLDANPGVDLGRFSPVPAAERLRLRAKLGLGPGPVVLSLRSGAAIYNLDVVIKAHWRLRARFPDATLVLASGDVPLAGGARVALARDAAGVKVLDRVAHADFRDYLRAATVGVSIPSSDGSPNSVWEALACGVPVVLSDLPQVRERVAGSPAAALVARRPDDVARAVAEMAIRGDELSGAARAWAESNVDREDDVARLERLYAAMTTGRARRPPAPPARPTGAAPPSAERTAPSGAAPRRPS